MVEPGQGESAVSILYYSSILSLTLTRPHTDTLISEEVSVQITNITLEYDESKPASDKRSVLKMQHLTASPALLYAAAQAGYGSDGGDEDGEDYDSEIDSDEYGASGSEGDEDELDDELMADLSKVSKASKASSSSKKVNGELAAELEGEDDDEDEMDDDDDEDDSEEDEDYDREEAEVQICSFIPGKVSPHFLPVTQSHSADISYYLTHMTGRAIHYQPHPARRRRFRTQAQRRLQGPLVRTLHHAAPARPRRSLLPGLRLGSRVRL